MKGCGDTGDVDDEELDAHCQNISINIWKSNYKLRVQSSTTTTATKLLVLPVVNYIKKCHFDYIRNRQSILVKLKHKIIQIENLDNTTKVGLMNNQGSKVIKN